MYSTCLFCNRDLGRNEVVERFAIGRRLAFDPAKGRLWVVCRGCERWNLTPLEERWEAIEECERLFAATRTRVSTDNVGLSRLRDGLELVRIGEARRPEFAAWRYGDQFGRRRTRQALLVGGGVAAVAGLLAGGAAAGIAVSGFGWSAASLMHHIVKGSPEKVVARVPTADGAVLHVRRRHLAETLIQRDGSGAFALRLRAKNTAVLLTGEEATRAAVLVLPAVNRFGGSRDEVQHAVGLIERAQDAGAYVARLAAAARVDDAPRDWRRRRWNGSDSKTEGLFALPKVDRLALEMALHEAQERRAMEGELAELERAWRDAEEIAGIADDMFLPAGVDERLKALRGE